MAAQLTDRADFYMGRDGSIHQLLAKTGKAWRSYRAYRATAAELSRLSVRDREDLGLAGQDMDAVARKAVYGF